MKTFSISLIVFIAIATMATETSRQNALQQDINGIQGSWKIEALEADGQPAPPQIVGTLKLVFKDDTLAFKPGEPGFTHYKYKLNPTVQPAGFAMTHADGTNIGESENGIYLLVGDRLKICFGSGKQRPKEFTAGAGSGQSMYSLERER